jgi:hypothetical protein
MERTPGDTPEDRAKYWTKIIEEGRQYPAGVTAFCDDRGINKNSYYGWFRRLRAEHPEWSDLKNNASHRAKRTKNSREKTVGKKTEVEPRATRRKFSAKYKQKILKELDEAWEEPSSKNAIGGLHSRYGQIGEAILVPLFRRYHRLLQQSEFMPPSFGLFRGCRNRSVLAGSGRCNRLRFKLTMASNPVFANMFCDAKMRANDLRTNLLLYAIKDFHS